MKERMESLGVPHHSKFRVFEFFYFYFFFGSGQGPPGTPPNVLCSGMYSVRTVNLEQSILLGMVFAFGFQRISISYGALSF